MTELLKTVLIVYILLVCSFQLALLKDAICYFYLLLLYEGV